MKTTIISIPLTAFFCGLVMVLSLGELKAQDPQFSQFYAAPLYLNPAFAGTTPHQRIITNYRNQWPSIPNGFITHALSYDINLDKFNSGAGVLLTTDQAGTVGLRSTTINGIYSYKLNIDHKWILSPAVMFGYGVRSMDYSRLVFGDQLQQPGFQPPTSDPSLQRLGNFHFFDIGTGLVTYNEYFWAGASAYHINEPNSSFMEDENFIPLKWSIHAGVRIPFQKSVFQNERNPAISPSFIYKQQGPFNQLDVGIQWFYEPIMTGVFYRGIPLKRDANGEFSRDALVFLLGINYKDLDFGYSYDFTISRLGPGSGGAHEISIGYSFYTRHERKKKKEKFIPCPTFRRQR
jgi:type IX secretion system PorP/SprF family membrane protein